MKLSILEEKSNQIRFNLIILKMLLNNDLKDIVPLMYEKIR